MAVNHHDHHANKKNESFTVAVEGNIGSGKTTFLDYFSEFENVEIFPEPVNKWRNVKGENALALMYQDPQRWGLTFHTYVQLTMLQQHLSVTKKPVKIMERSISGTKYCFVENLYENGLLKPIDYFILTEWFDWLQNNHNLKVDLYVYLQTNPELLHKRIKLRDRTEEHSIPLNYLKSVHQLHEDWLVKKTRFQCSAPVIIINADATFSDMKLQYDKYKQQILFGYN